MKTERLWAAIRIFITFTFLFTVWIIFTWRLGLSSLIFGAAGSFLIASITFRVFIPTHQASLKFIIPNPFYLILYLFTMVWAVYRSSFTVLKAIVGKKETPRIVHFRTHLRSDLARTFLALSVTFTPGTICVDLNDDHLTVHWLTCDTTHSKEAGEKIKGKLEFLIGRMFS